MVQSVKDFGAVGDGIADDTAAIQAAVNDGYSFVPEGIYRLFQTINVPSNSGLHGVSSSGCLLFALDITGPVLEIINGVHQRLSDLNISGKATKAIATSNCHNIDIDRVRTSSDDPIELSDYTGGFGFVIGFDFITTFSSSLTNLSTDNTGISHHCFSCGASFNSNLCQNWYTSNGNCETNFLVDGGDGSSFTMLTAQGGRIGLNLLSGAAHSFDTLLTVETAIPLSLGNNSRVVRGCVFNNLSLRGPGPSHVARDERGANIQIENADTVLFNSVRFTDLTGDLDGIFYNLAVNITINSIYWEQSPYSDSEMSFIIKRKTGASPQSGFVMHVTTRRGGTLRSEKICGFIYTGAERFTHDYAVMPPLRNHALYIHTTLTPYRLGHFVFVGDAIEGNDVYECVAPGVSGANAAPSGQSDGLTDGNVVWNHYGKLL